MPGRFSPAYKCGDCPPCPSPGPSTLRVWMDFDSPGNAFRLYQANQPWPLVQFDQTNSGLPSHLSEVRNASPNPDFGNPDFDGSAGTTYDPVLDNIVYSRKATFDPGDGGIFAQRADLMQAEFAVVNEIPFTPAYPFQSWLFCAAGGNQGYAFAVITDGNGDPFDPQVDTFLYRFSYPSGSGTGSLWDQETGQGNTFGFMTFDDVNNRLFYMHETQGGTVSVRRDGTTILSSVGAPSFSNYLTWVPSVEKLYFYTAGRREIHKCNFDGSGETLVHRIRDNDTPVFGFRYILGRMDHYGDNVYFFLHRGTGGTQDGLHGMFEINVNTDVVTHVGNEALWSESPSEIQSSMLFMLDFATVKQFAGTNPSAMTRSCCTNPL